MTPRVPEDKDAGLGAEAANPRVPYDVHRAVERLLGHLKWPIARRRHQESHQYPVHSPALLSAKGPSKSLGAAVEADAHNCCKACGQARQQSTVEVRRRVRAWVSKRGSRTVCM